MPDGRTHTVAAIVALLLSAVVVAGVQLFGLWWTPVSAVAYLIGTKWLSPDLDLVSQPYMAWGPLRIIWWPYMMLVPHRSWWSHGPVIGTLARIASLVIVSAIVTGCLVLLGVVTPLAVKEALRIDLWIIIATLVGLELSALVHIALDRLLKN